MLPWGLWGQLEQLRLFEQNSVRHWAKITINNLLTCHKCFVPHLGSPLVQRESVEYLPYSPHGGHAQIPTDKRSHSYLQSGGLIKHGTIG